MLRSFAFWLYFITIGLTVSSYLVMTNNVYMTERNYPVTYTHKYVVESCVKSHCRDRYMGRFVTDEGQVFSRHISDYMYNHMRIGEQFDLTLRPMDIKQTPKDNALWFFGPVILYSVNLVFLFIVFVCTIVEVYDYRKKKLRV